MRKLSAKSIVEFRGMSDRRKKTFAMKLMVDAIKNTSKDGGDYWVTSLSAISNFCRESDPQTIKSKIESLKGKRQEPGLKRTKDMHQRNLDILYQYENFDLTTWLPPKQVSFLKKHHSESIISIKELQIQALPHHVFTFKRNGIDEVGAIWLIAKLGGYRKDELGLFTEILYRYLKIHYSKSYPINLKYCLAVDVTSKAQVNFSQVHNGSIPALLVPTVNEIKGLM